MSGELQDLSLLIRVCLLPKPLLISVLQCCISPETVSLPIHPVPPSAPTQREDTGVGFSSDLCVLDCGVRYFYSLLLVLRTIWYIVRQMIDTSYSSPMRVSDTSCKPSMLAGLFSGKKALAWGRAQGEGTADLASLHHSRLCMKGMAAALENRQTFPTGRLR